MNVFKTLFNNPAFWIIMGIEFAIQEYIMFSANLSLGPLILGTAPLNQNQRITCWVLGFMSLVLHPILKKVPLSLFSFMNKFDLEGDLESNFAKKFMDSAKKQASDSQQSLKKTMAISAGNDNTADIKELVNVKKDSDDSSDEEKESKGSQLD